MTRPFLAIAALALLASPAPADGPRPGEDLLRLYEHFHTHPELSFKEVNTAKTVADELKAAGAEVTPGVGKLGVVGVMKNGPGPTVLVRSDLDALPVTEATGLPYASKATTKDDEGNTVGVMHACGHDVHMTCLVGTARWLSAHKDGWSGTVIFIGQPAEEKVGARRKCSPTASTRGSRSPISPWRCTSPTTWRPASSPIAPARRWRARPRWT